MPYLTCQVLDVCAMCAWCKLPCRHAFQNTHAASAGAYGAGAHAMLGSNTLAATGAACGPAPALTPPLSLALGASAPGESIPLDSRATVAVLAAIGSKHFNRRQSNAGSTPGHQCGFAIQIIACGHWSRSIPARVPISRNALRSASRRRSRSSNRVAGSLPPQS